MLTHFYSKLHFDSERNALVEEEDFDVTIVTIKINFHEPLKTGTGDYFPTCERICL